ncbi:MAG TPA: beta-ketoacyl-ACP synthase II [Anaerolineales bacterium]|nr:beta-ketoacyl-ACP synthase II [Anaerolineales bacterium]
MDPSTRIVITGLGALTPVGNNIPEMWAALSAGSSGITRITQFDPQGFDTQIAGEVKGFDPQALFGLKEARRLDRATQFAAVAARQAMADAGLESLAPHSDRAAVIIGSGIGGPWTIYSEVRRFVERGPHAVSPFFIPMAIPDSPAAQVAIETGARGINLAVSSACATGTNAVGEGAWLIRRGEADIVLAGGAEAGVVPVVMAGFGNMKTLSTHNDDPPSACRPFDATRDGFVMGEGAGVLVLERYEHARARGARIYAELLGYGSTVDATHWAAPLEGGHGLARAIQLALERAGLAAEQVDYINAHGTGTRLNDRIETQSIKAVFRESAYRTPISSTKSMTGHMMGAAGAVEAIICVKALETGCLPPTINYRVPDPECDLDYLPNQARRSPITVALSNSLGMGGHNAALVFRKVEQ